jgi:formylglycine-generating enzyme required for sulfatase activity
MALANVGCALARDPKLTKPVLVIDWDLEAPGLHRYLRGQVVTAFDGEEARFESALGLIDLFIELRGCVEDAADASEQDFDGARSLLDTLQLEKYIVKTDVPRLHLLKAGRFDDDYATNIGSFRWPELYRQSPHLLRAFADRLARDYSFVLIDSRTGLTDTAGICAMLMPEVLVTVFTPNRQSLYGVIELVRKAARYRSDSDDLRPLLVFPLPSRIEASEPALRQVWRFGDSNADVPGFQEMFEQAFKEIYELSACNLSPYFDDVQIQHLPSYAYGEEIAVLVEESRDRFSLTQSYLRFAARLMKADVPWVSSSSREEAVDDQILLQRHLPLDSGWRWFLSYNSQDFDLAQRLVAGITRKDPEARVFYAPKSLRSGAYWMPELAKGIAESNAFVLLVGERGIGSWQAVEYAEALDKRVNSPDFPIIVVLLEGQTAPGLPFLRRLHWIITPDPGSEKTVAQVIDAAAGGGPLAGELWRYAAPYRGLAAMTESDSEYFFGRDNVTAEVIEVLARTPDKLPLLIGNSGVGKSSVAQAGVLAALMRQGWPETTTTEKPWPQALCDSRTWCVLKLKPGAAPVRALVDEFLAVWQFDPVDPGRVKRLAEWTDNLSEGRGTLSDLIDITQRQLEERGLTKPPVFVIYVDQGEELYVRSEQRQGRRFAELLASGLGDPRLRVMMSMRSDFLGELQKDEPLFVVRQQIDVPPLREAQLRDVVTLPAKLLSARFETERLADDIVRRATVESLGDSGALPLLSYLLDEMWLRMVERGDGVLRLPAKSLELASVLIDRANSFLATHPDSEAQIRRIFTLKLATVLEDGEPTRRRAFRSEFSDEEWRLVTELADHPTRLLVTASSEGGESYAEVAHEAIFRRWDRLREWIAAEREFLAWRSELESARRTWQATPERSKNDALLMGLALARSQTWLARRSADIPGAERQFITQSQNALRKRRLRLQALGAGLGAAVLAGIGAWLEQDALAAFWRYYAVTRPYIASQVSSHVLTAASEAALKPSDTFSECARGQGKDYCPELVVVPAGQFTMGSPANEQSRSDNEGPQHIVTIARAFAVSRAEVTFDEWDTCVAYGDCSPVSDGGWGRGQRPVILVEWSDAQRYVTWLSKVTGRNYRLLSEAEYEYAARGGTQTAYPWGDSVGKNNANCDGCGSQWDNRQTAPVGAFAPNKFGLYDVVGNVLEWVEDCYHDAYAGAPTDGSAWLGGVDCSRRVARGGSWNSAAASLRSASRSSVAAESRAANLGFRVGRTLAVP